MEELQAEEERLRLEMERAENARKANAALFSDMDRMPGNADAQGSSSSSRPPQSQPATQSQPASSSPSAKAQPTAKADEGGSSSSSRSPATNSQAHASAPAYVPPGWSGRVPKHLSGGEGAEPIVEAEGISLPLCGCGLPPGGVPGSAQLLDMLGLHLPSTDSFEEFFHKWFEEEFFPILGKKLKTELVHRAKSKGFFSGLSSQVKKWAMANTDERLQADVWYAYFMQHSPPQFQSAGLVLQASVNLGSAAQPCLVTFWGLPDTQGDGWMLPPWASYDDVEMSAVLDELDERGGMSALVSAAA